ncbi:MAG: glycoside hydrolase family 3 protein [Deltaproteobacteria bacterium]|nr:glycoside hydrolase family 3 protein [Deltaproteobacteria bacterium]
MKIMRRTQKLPASCSLARAAALVLSLAGLSACGDDDTKPKDTVTATDTSVADGDTTVEDGDTATTTDTETSTDVTATETVTDVTTPDVETDVTTTDTIADGDTGPTAECDKPANVARRQALLDAQPEIETRARSKITATKSWASLADDAQVTCSVELEFKDSNGSGSLQPYEDWTLTPAERAADLVTKMSANQKMALVAHPSLTDAPAAGNTAVSAGLQGQLANGVRFGRVTAVNGPVTARATWANNVQEACEGHELGIPFVLSQEPAHFVGNGRAKAAGFSRWPQELGLAASDDPAVLETFGKVAAQELSAVGVRMALSIPADLATESRRFASQFTLGEDHAAVAERVAAYIKGLQGEALGPASVAAVVGQFPGAGPAEDGGDARLAKGKFLVYPGNRIDDHIAPFEAAIDAGAGAVMTAYGIPKTGAWTGLDGALAGTTIEQVGAAFNDTIVDGALRGELGFGGLVIAPWGAFEDAGTSPLGAPWGVEALAKHERVAKAMNAGVDQLGGLADRAIVGAARTAQILSDETIDAAATRILTLTFTLGLFEDPYVDPTKAPALVNTDPSYRAGLDAMNRSMVLVVNANKPAGWLNGDGDGTQLGDKGNAGNGTLKVLPAPPGEPYVSAGCSYFIMGNFDLDYVRSVSNGYGEMTNDATSIDGIDVDTPEERIALTDYVFIRIDAPFTDDPDSGPLLSSLAPLDYAGNANASELDDLAFARDAIDALPTSKTQIVVGIDAGRAPLLDEIQAYGVSAIYVEWGVTDKVFLDVAFGIVDGKGKLPVGLPASNAAAGTQLEDVARDGAHATFVEGFGLTTESF